MPGPVPHHNDLVPSEGQEATEVPTIEAGEIVYMEKGVYLKLFRHISSTPASPLSQNRTIRCRRYRQPRKF